MSQPPTPAETQEIIRLHAAAARRNRLAKRLLTFALVAIVAGNVWYAYETVRDTAEHRTEELSAALAAEAESLAPDLAKTGTEAIGRLATRYSDTFAKTFERDRERYAEALLREMEAMQSHAVSVEPRLMEALQALGGRLEADLKSGLAGHGIPEDKLVAAGEAYAAALEERVGGFIAGPLEDYRGNVESIVAKLDRLAAEEPPPPTEDPVFLIGMALEWVGRDLQKSSSGAALGAASEKPSNLQK